VQAKEALHGPEALLDPEAAFRDQLIEALLGLAQLAATNGFSQ
jgi:hypothetical protein